MESNVCLRLACIACKIPNVEADQPLDIHCIIPELAPAVNNKHKNRCEEHDVLANFSIILCSVFVP
jgi:hypothetical protein